MNWLDLLVLAALTASAGSGLKLGLNRPVVAFLGICVGWLLSIKWRHPVASLLSDSDPTKATIIFVSYFTVMVVALALAFFADRFIALLWPIARPVPSSMINRVGGASLGLMIGGVLSGAIVLGLARLSHDDPLLVLRQRVYAQ